MNLSVGGFYVRLPFKTWKQREATEFIGLTDFWDYWIAVNGQSQLYENRTAPTHAVLGMPAHLKSMPGRKMCEL